MNELGDIQINSEKSAFRCGFYHILISFGVIVKDSHYKNKLLVSNELVTVSIISSGSC